MAINLDDARIADNAGQQPIDEAVVPGAAAAYFSTLPIKAIVAALRGAGAPAAVSPSAGSDVCNHVFFGLQHALVGSSVRSGFMHLPLLPEQAARAPGEPSLELATMVSPVPAHPAACARQTTHEKADSRSQLQRTANERKSLGANAFRAEPSLLQLCILTGTQSLRMSCPINSFARAQRMQVPGKLAHRQLPSAGGVV